MVIRALDHVPHCYTWQDGQVIASLIDGGFRRGNMVTLSFDGVDDVPSSFVNGALLSLLDRYSFHHIKANLAIVNSTSQINDIIHRRFKTATKEYVAA